MAGTLLQEVACSAGGGNPVTVTITVAAGGSSLHVVGMNLATSGTVTFSDNKSNTYPSAGAGQNNTVDTAGGATGAQSWAINAASGSTTASANYTNPVGPGIGIREWGSVSTTAIDNNGAAFTASTTTPSMNLTLNSAGASISSWCFDTNANQTPAAGAGYTAGVSGQFVGGRSEQQHFTTTGSKAVNYTITFASQVLIFAAAFDDAGGAAITVHPLMMMGMGN